METLGQACGSQRSDFPNRARDTATCLCRGKPGLVGFEYLVNAMTQLIDLSEFLQARSFSEMAVARDLGPSCTHLGTEAGGERLCAESLFWLAVPPLITSRMVICYAPDLP